MKAIYEWFGKIKNIMTRNSTSCGDTAKSIAEDSLDRVIAMEQVSDTTSTKYIKACRDMDYYMSHLDYDDYDRYKETEHYKSLMLWGEGTEW